MKDKDQVPKCSECLDKEFRTYNGRPSRYYCTNREAAEQVHASARKIRNCDRGKSELKIKTSPKWCPKRK